MAGLDRERVFYPTLFAVIGTYYRLFAVMGGSTATLTAESVVACSFLMAAVVFQKNLWIVVAVLLRTEFSIFLHRWLIGIQV